MVDWASWAYLLSSLLVFLIAHDLSPRVYYTRKKISKKLIFVFWLVMDSLSRKLCNLCIEKINLLDTSQSKASPLWVKRLKTIWLTFGSQKQLCYYLLVNRSTPKSYVEFELFQNPSTWHQCGEFLSNWTWFLSNGSLTRFRLLLIKLSLNMRNS